MNKWKCANCGFVKEQEEPPEKCPVCFAKKFVVAVPSKFAKKDKAN